VICTLFLCYNLYAGAVPGNGRRSRVWVLRRRDAVREHTTERRGRVQIDAFYASPQWRRKRELILRRDGYRCQECRRYGRITQATTVHHIQHLEDRPDLALVSSNLVSLCRACHAKAHPEKGGARPGSGEQVRR